MYEVTENHIGTSHVSSGVSYTWIKVVNLFVWGMRNRWWRGTEVTWG